MLRWLANNLIWVLISLTVVAIASGMGVVDIPGLDPTLPNDPEQVDSSELDRMVHQEINDEREKRGLEKLEYDRELSDIAEGHSEDMSANGFVGHEGSDGSDFQDRYRDAGYECNIELASGMITSGSENVAQTWYEERLVDGKYIDSQDELVQNIVAQWMNSTGHRENILRPYWETQGIGVVISDEDRVYATQNFC